MKIFLTYLNTIAYILKYCMINLICKLAQNFSAAPNFVWSFSTITLELAMQKVRKKKGLNRSIYLKQGPYCQYILGLCFNEIHHCESKKQH